MSEKLFTVELIPNEEKVEIHTNEAGLTFLIEQLETLKRFKESDHLHLFTPQFGGEELTNEKQNQNPAAVLANHLQLFLWKD